MLNKTSQRHINHMIEMYRNEQQPFRKVHRMIDLFEVIIKTHTALMIADYFRINNLSDNIKKFLAEGLNKPSLGIWQCFTRAITYELVLPQKINEQQYNAINKVVKSSEIYSKYLDDIYVLNKDLNDKSKKKKIERLINSDYEFINKPFIKDFYKYFMEWDKRISREENNVINLRNSYAHNATPSDQQCIHDIEKYTEILEYMIKADWLNNTYTCVFENKNNILQSVKVDGEENTNSDLINKVIELNKNNIKEYVPYIVNEAGEVLELFPIMIYKKLDSMEPSILFFNDLPKKNSIAILNYPYSIRYIDEELYKPFTSRINIETWKKYREDSFTDIINKESEGFVGRENEIKQVKNFINDKQSGYLFIYGKPGIGKTSLVSKIICELMDEPLDIIRYFVRKSNASSLMRNFQQSIIVELNDKYKLNLKWEKDITENNHNIEYGLKEVSKLLKHRKLVIFIDGIDEFIFKNQGNFIDNLISDEYQNIIIIYSCRANDEIQKFYRRINSTVKEKLSLGELSKDDIWQILSSRSNKYDLTNEYIDKIIIDSKGNPLYIELLCKTLENGKSINSIVEKLPESIEQWFEEFIKRYREEDLGECILKIIDVFAASKDSINYKYIFEVLNQDTNNKFTETDVQNSVDKLQEILIESDKAKDFYFLFHEKFGEYICTSRKDNIIEAEKKIISLCSDWRKYKEFSFRKYIGEFYSAHLDERKKYNELIELAMDSNYVDFQIETTKDYSCSFELFELALKAAAESNDYDNAAEIIMKRINLYTKNNTRIIELFNNLGEGNAFEDLLNNIPYCDEKGKVIIYINLLNYSLFSLSNVEDKRKHIERVLENIENNISDDAAILNWLDIIPMYFLVRIMAEIKELGLNFRVIMKRMRYSSYFSSLGIRVSNYNGTTIEYESWIYSCDLSNSELEIINEMRRTDKSFSEELSRNEELSNINEGNLVYFNTKKSKISKLINSKDINKLLKAFEKNQHQIPIYLGYLISECSDDSFIDEVIEKLKDNPANRDIVLSFLVNIYRETDILKAYEISKEINDYSRRISCYEVIVSKLIQNGLIEKANEILNDVEENVNFNETPWLIIEKNNIVACFIDHYFNNKDIEKVKYYYDKLENCEYKNDKILCSGYIIELLIVNGNYEEAIGLIYEQYKASLRKDVHIFYELIEALVIKLSNNNYVDEASLIIQYIYDEDIRNKVFRNLLDMVVQDGSFKDFINILNKQLMQKNNTLIDKEKVEESFIRNLYAKGNLKEARTLLNSILERNNKINSKNVKLENLKKITMLLLELECFEDFINIYEVFHENIEEALTGVEKLREYKNIVDRILVSICRNKDMRLVELMCHILKTKIHYIEEGQNIIQKAIDTLIDLEIYDKAEELLDYMNKIFTVNHIKAHINYKIYISNRFYKLNNLIKSSSILKHTFEEVLGNNVGSESFKDILCILDEALNQGIGELLEKGIEYINLLSGDIEKDEKYLLQLHKYGYKNEVDQYLNKELKLIDSAKVTNNLKDYENLLEKMKKIAELTAAIHEFDTCIKIINRIYEYEENYNKLYKSKHNSINLDFNLFKESYLIRVTIELMKEGKEELILNNIKSVQINRLNKNFKEFLDSLKKSINRMENDKALKLISIINIVSVNAYSGLHEFIADLYIEGHKELAFAFIEKDKRTSKVYYYLKIIQAIRGSNEAVITEIIDLSNKINDGNELVSLFSDSARDMDRDLLLKFIESINGLTHVQEDIKQLIYKEIVKVNQEVDLEVLLKIMSYRCFNEEVLKRFLELYSIYIRCNRKDTTIKILQELKEYVYIPEFYKDNSSNNYKYANLNSWINKIQDEDNVMIIELLARKVSKNKLSEDDFNREIKKYIN